MRISDWSSDVCSSDLDLVRNLGRSLGSGLDELTITTNGNQLAKHAEALAEAGVRRINVSLDTLRADRFRQITRWGDLGRVLGGIEAAHREIGRAACRAESCQYV